jgi:hypothetical protein
MMVELLADCTRCGGMSPACHVCHGGGYEPVSLPAAEGTRTEALLRLAEAAVALAKFPQGFGRCPPDHEAAIAAYTQALSAVRAFDREVGE